MKWEAVSKLETGEIQVKAVGLGDSTQGSTVSVGLRFVFFFACLFCFSFCLWVIFLGVLWVSVTLYLSSVWWDFSHLLFQIFYSILFLLYLVLPLNGHYTFCSCPTVLDKLSNLEILFPAFDQYNNKHNKASLYFC